VLSSTAIISTLTELFLFFFFLVFTLKMDGISRISTQNITTHSEKKHGIKKKTFTVYRRMKEN
jgi:hypothetical protein